MENNEKKILLLVPEDRERFQRWCDRYGLKVRTSKKLDPDVEVTYTNAVDIYWLGANFCSGRDTVGVTLKEASQIIKQSGLTEGEGNA